MRVPTLLRNLRTSRKHAVVAAGATAALLVMALVLWGGSVFGVAGKGVGWVVDRTVRVVAYRNTAPESETTEARARVAVARSPLERVKGTEAPAAPAAEEPGPPALQGGEAEPDASVEEATLVAVPAPDVLTDSGLPSSLDEERFGDRSGELPYRSFGMRDPMTPLVVPGKMDDAGGRFSIYGLVLVGLAWKNSEALALCEDKYHKTWLFREGDWTKDGARVVDIADNSITFAQLRYGETSRHTIRLAAREGEN
ncbi:MAG: hypothetical protein JW958_08460 [Candidatus Eisenbacteria bacterium]|nr:hypothetical protein [Candidatus Eisenbacteria bacterium]